MITEEREKKRKRKVRLFLCFFFFFFLKAHVPKFKDEKDWSDFEDNLIDRLNIPTVIVNQIEEKKFS
jgi:hypothetical protein